MLVFILLLKRSNIMSSTIKVLIFFILSTYINANTLKDLKTFQANFTQVITNPSGKEIYYSGEINIKEPNSIKWKYEKPFEKLVFIKKYTVTIIEPELEQAIVTRLDKEINILTLIKTAKKIQANKYLSNFNNIDYYLYFDQELLTRITYEDELENKVVISFTKVQQNISIENSIFKFYIPVEYDLIKK